MMYADGSCRYKEEYHPHRYVFTGKCVECKNEMSVAVPARELNSYRRGELIQTAMPSLSRDEREFLMSGICGPCFDKMFKE